ncbi:WD40 repeat-like protein [Cylindrobasidium torrendii FP15055 ss-10]|uniref:Polyadenylation factor subunit 2 n=1 Tax=Cylindrobasidium torrendii FP15055 ss-10 TaxID=1314674 RepID=A0A0D7B189_9AGAR|nr:WD40 repeat-like protein [Cylindrobasidium torrendii FP15055 ss-10]
MAAATALPLLLPAKYLPQPKPANSFKEWRPKQYLEPPIPPAPLDIQDIVVDGRVVKRTRPRKTVDYFGGMGRWTSLQKTRPTPGYYPYPRPSPPEIINLLPPKAYKDNTSTSLCTRFVHTSTNKIRCPVNVVTWTPEGRRILTGSTSGEFTLWNGLTFNFETILQAHDAPICHLTFTHSGHYLVSADKSGVIKYFEPNMNNLTQFPGSKSNDAIRGVSFSPDDQRFATASDDSLVRIWSFQSSQVESTIRGHGWDVKCVEWHPSKGLIVSGSKDNMIKFWDPRSGQNLSTLHTHKNTIQALSWSPTGNLLASASRDQTVRLFDIRAMKEFRILKGHQKEVNSVAWHPTAPLLTSGGSEGAVLHWDIEADHTTSGTISQPRAALEQAHDSNVWSMAYHPLGHLMVSASNDHTTRFWSRERPGDASAGAGEKPPDVTDGQEEDEDAMVPGFSYGAGGAPQWGWGLQDEAGTNGDKMDTSMSNGAGGSNDFLPGLGGGLPGLGGSNSFPPSLPPMGDHYDRERDHFGGGGGGGDDWDARHNRGGRGGGRGRGRFDDRDDRRERDSGWGRDRDRGDRDRDRGDRFGGGGYRRGSRY